jgi:hypothetical protein
MAATYERIQTSTTSSTQSIIDFTSIPSTYTDLRVVLFCPGSASNYVRMKFNLNTEYIYSNTVMRGNGNATQFAKSNNQNDLYLNDTDNGDIYPMFFTIDIADYAGSQHKSYLVTNSCDRNAYNGGGNIMTSINTWRKTDAITSIRFQGVFLSGTIATVYGIKAA